MRVSSQEVRKLVQEEIEFLAAKQFLFEAKCPTCGAPGAYVGATSVECTNPSCDHFVSGTNGQDHGLSDEQVDAFISMPGIMPVLHGEIADSGSARQAIYNTYQVDFEDGKTTIEDVAPVRGREYLSVTWDLRKRAWV